MSFRSLCRRCNTDLLGARYDPALGEFSAQVRALASSPLALPPAVAVTVRPQPVMRSVLGHLAAQGAERYEKGIYTEPIRDYLLDSDLPLPPQLRMYYWLYPYRSTVLICDAARIEQLGSGRGGVAFWLTKFYPLAFMVTLREPSQQRLYRIGDLDRLSGDLGVHGLFHLCKYSNGIVYSFNATQLCPMQVQDNGPPGAGAGNLVGFKAGEHVDGMTKVCVYNVIGKLESIRIGSVDVCPLSYNF